MSNVNQDQLKALFEQALDLPPEERTAFLDDQCAGNEDLRAELDSLLEHAVDEPDFLDNLAGLVFKDAPTTHTDKLIGQQVKHYEILERLGGGGMGVVYKARDTKLGRPVALKFLAPHLTADEGLKKRFMQEARAASSLDHSNIGTIHEINETEDNQLFIAMAYYDGQTLRSALSDGPLPIPVAINYATQIAKGLSSAHRATIIHRDIKPANVIITNNDTVKIVDFGLAKMAGESQLTKTGSTIGTMAYISPEHLQGQEVDGRTDIWSLGVVLYEMLTGERPFKGHHDHAVMYGVMHVEPKLVTEIDPELPDALATIVQRTLQKDPADRYINIDAFIDDLNAFTRGEAPSKDRPATPSGAKRTGAKRSNKTWWIGSAFVLLGALAAGIFALNLLQPAAPAPQASPQRITFTGNAFMPALSPNGELMAYYSQDTDSLGSIKIQEVSGGQPIEALSGITIPPFQDRPFRWSRDGKMLAVPAIVDGNSALYLLSRLGNQIRAINERGTAIVSWSPDGSSIAMMAAAVSTLFIVDISTLKTTEIELDRELKYINGIDWSPSGDTFALTTETDTGYQLATFDMTGQLVQVIAEDSLLISSPRWNTKSDGIYYLKQDGRERGLWKTQISTSGKRKGKPRLLQTGLSMGYNVSLSGNNTHLLHYSDALYSNVELIDTKDPDNLVSQKLTDGTSLITYPRISSDDSQIAFLMENTEGNDVYTMPLTGGELQQRTRTPGISAGLAWEPSGNRIVFGALGEGGGQKVWLLNLESGQTKEFGNSKLHSNSNMTWGASGDIIYNTQVMPSLVQLDPDTEEESYVLDYDTTGFIFSPRYSPDGSDIAAYRNMANFGRTGLWKINVENQSVSYLNDLHDNVNSPELSRGVVLPLKWSTDGKWIYATTFAKVMGNTSHRIFKVAAEGSSVDLIATIPSTDNPDFFPNLDITSDGRYIIAAVAKRQSDIYLLEDFDPDVE